MGYYLCPRCGSKDSFVGNELVSGSESLGSVGMVNSEGAYVQRNQGSRLRHKQVEVVKCRDCGEILGDQNWRYTPEEIAQQEKARAEREARQKELDAQSRKETRIAIIGICLFLVLYGIGWGALVIYEDFKKAKLAAKLEAEQRAEEVKKREIEAERIEAARKKAKQDALDALIAQEANRLEIAEQKEDLRQEWALLPPGKKFIYTYNDGDPKTDISKVYLNQPEEVLTKAFGETVKKHHENSFAYYLFRGIPIKMSPLINRVNGLAIHPATGLPINPNGSSSLSLINGLAIDSATGLPIDPNASSSFSLINRYTVVFKMKLNTESKWVVAGLESASFPVEFVHPSEFNAPTQSANPPRETP